MMFDNGIVVASDLDETLCQKRHVICALREGFGKEVPEELFHLALKRASESMYSVERHLAELRNLRCIADTDDVVLENVYDALNRRSDLLFPDALPFLLTARERMHCRVGVITYGHQPWQLSKIYASQLPPLDFVFYTGVHGEKGDILRKAFPNAERIIFVDDSLIEVEGVAKIPQAESWLVQRGDATPPASSSGYQVCRSLAEIEL